MLKEVFLIDRSVLQFHYNSEGVSYEDDKAILSSGFLSAIQDFSSHARSDILESFSTENEYFLFQQCKDSLRILVGVFDRRASEPIARKVLNDIMSLLRTVEMPDTDGLQLPQDVKAGIRDRIDNIQLQYFGSEQLGRIVTDILESRSDIPLAFLIDITDNSMITKFSRPRPLFKMEQVRDFLLVHTTLQKTLNSLDLPTDYSNFMIESQDYAIVACTSGRLVSVAAGAMKTPTLDVYGAAMSMCEATPISNPRIPDYSESSKSKSVLLNDGTIRNLHGSIPLKSNIQLSTLINNIDGFSRILTRRSFVKFTVRLLDSHLLKITRSNDEWIIDVVNIDSQ